MTIRFPADVPYDKWPAVDLVYGKIIQGDMAGAKAAYDAAPQDVQDAIGSVNWWRAQFVPTPVSTITPPLAAFETRVISDGSPGVIYAVQAGADGGFSVEISGSPLVTFSAGEKGVFDPSRTTQGAGTGTPQRVLAGEWCNWTYVAGNSGQTMRPQLL